MLRLEFVSATPEALQNRHMLAQGDSPALELGQLLREFPSLSLRPLHEDDLRLPVKHLLIQVFDRPPEPDSPVYLPPGTTMAMIVAATATATVDAATPEAAGPAAEPPQSAQPQPEPAESPQAGEAHPVRLSERQAVLVAHQLDIDRSAAYLSSGLSVLIRCEKLLVEHVAGEIAVRSGRAAQTVRLTPQDSATQAGGAPLGGPAGALDAAALGGGRRAELLAVLHRAVTESPVDDVVVVPHLDLLAGGSDSQLSSEARELTDVLYERSERVLLAFTDPSLVIPEVLANRFAVRLAMDILPRTVPTAGGGQAPLGQALITASEAELFSGFDSAGLYKHVAGMNAVRLRHALRFAFHQRTAAVAGGPALVDRPARPTFADLLGELRTFKARTSSAFEVPDVPFDAIGGYQAVKEELIRAMDIVGGAAELPERLRHDLVPRGFIFHGPPGTGKTLFAKAVASRLGATILVVSGPEITDMYVGESERKVRDLFTEARRNAPAVIVFDEFDSIAAQRSGRDDGGSRAGNAIVAQLLTELDGFRPEVPVLIIGTTNRIDLIDDALLRPSRFRPIKIDLPDRAARREIARVHAQHFEIDLAPVLLERVTTATEGMNGDEIRSVFRDARAEQFFNHARGTDARRLGELVGALRRDRQQRDLDRGRRAAAPARTRRPATVPLAGNPRPVPTGPAASVRMAAEAPAQAAEPTAQETLHDQRGDST